MSHPNVPPSQTGGDTRTARPLTIEEAVLYTSTRRAPPHAIPPSHRNENIEDHSSSHHESIKPNPTPPSILNTPGGCSRNSEFHVLTDATDCLVHPPAPKRVTKQHLLSIPPDKRTVLVVQSVYALTFHHLDRRGGWLWWEHTLLDTARVDATCDAPTDLSATHDDIRTSHIRGRGKGSKGGEEEQHQQETPNNDHDHDRDRDRETTRTQNNKRLAAYLTRYTLLGIVE